MVSISSFMLKCQVIYYTLTHGTTNGWNLFSWGLLSLTSVQPHLCPILSHSQKHKAGFPVSRENERDHCLAFVT